MAVTTKLSVKYQDQINMIKCFPINYKKMLLFGWLLAVETQ
jgi:hypothetical protein